MIWLVDGGCTGASDLASKLSGDFAVRRIASLRSLAHMLALEDRPQSVVKLIILNGFSHLDDLEGLANIHRILKINEHITMSLFGDISDDLKKLAALYNIPCVTALESDGIELKRRIQSICSDAKKQKPNETQCLKTADLNKKTEDLVIGDITFQAANSTLNVHGASAAETLSPKEAKILSSLIIRVNQLVTRDQLSEHAWRDVKVSARTIDSHISRLRRRLESSVECRIEAVYGQGYILKVGERIS